MRKYENDSYNKNDDRTEDDHIYDGLCIVFMTKIVIYINTYKLCIHIWIVVKKIQLMKSITKEKHKRYFAFLSSLIEHCKICMRSVAVWIIVAEEIQFVCTYYHIYRQWVRRIVGIELWFVTSEICMPKYVPSRRGPILPNTCIYTHYVRGQ